MGRARRKLCPQSVWDVDALLEAFKAAGVKEAHAYKLWNTLLRNPATQWHDVPDLPRAACQLLEAHFSRSTSSLLCTRHSVGGDTTKLLLQLQDGLQVEAVVMHYDTTDRYSSQAEAAGWGRCRATLCVSSQVGCQMGCTFCATGSMGLQGSLSCGEILEQLVHARAVAPVRNVVFMGMGEPLQNYEAVRNAVAAMTDSRTFGLARRHVTVSTVGVIPRLKDMARDMQGVSLALSLHAPSQELRCRIVPSARAYPLTRLMAAVEEYQAATGQRVFIEYVMLAGVNDGEAQATQLGELLQGRDVVVNLIPWNPVYSTGAAAFQAPPAAGVARFQAVLREVYGLPCTVRQEKGQDIAGACGQLVIEQGMAQQQATSGSCGQQGNAGAAVADIEELARA